MSQVCASCKQALEVELQEDGEDVEMQGSSSQANANTVPDDCLLNCGCHFHWYGALVPSLTSGNNSFQAVSPRRL